MKKVVKIVVAVILSWLASLVAIGRYLEHKGPKIIYLRWDRTLNSGNHTLSSFNTWHLIPQADSRMSEKEKLTIVDGDNFPPGNYGKPVNLKKGLPYHIRQKIREGWREQSFNKFVSDLIPVNRSLLDPRDEWCKAQNYSDLPTFSVVICFNNEAWSTLIRTITSVLARSPQELLKEIILVDDLSTTADLQQQLDDFVQATKKVKLIRPHKRKGLIRARLIGARHATTPVVAFLDSHCECNVGWIEPLLNRIKEDPTAVVSPVIDHIHETTFEYILQNLSNPRIGGFTWELRFRWIQLPEKVLKSRKNPSAHLRTPTIPGGIFAINKEYFAKLGYYDEGLEIWGAENFELSFKTWMCGGTLEIIPCSRVGHVFKKSFPRLKTQQWDQKFYKRNNVRLAEVWLDDYAKYFYERIGDLKGDFGDVQERKKLRAKLKCKSFKWYLENVYPQIEDPNSYVASGQIYSLDEYNLCFDEPPIVNLKGFISLWPCHFQGGNQFWTYAPDATIRRDNLCLDYVENIILSLNICTKSATQLWLYSGKDHYIRHRSTGKCLNINKYPRGFKLVASNCTQRWMLENFKPEKMADEFRSKL